MPSQGYTVIPDIQVNEVTGEEIINVMNASVIGDTNKQAIRDEVQREAADNVQVNELGELETAMDFNEQDATNLLEQFGGEEVYTEALKWAGQNLSEEDIDEYDAKMKSGNIAEVNHYMGMLMDRYHNAQNESSDYGDFESYFFNEVVSQDYFPSVQNFMRESMDADYVEKTNAALDSGDYELYEAAIRHAIYVMENGQ